LATHIERVIMELHQAIYGRRSIRDYRDAPIADEVIEGLLADAVQAPNAIDRQAWSFVVVRGRERLARYSREALASLSPQHVDAGLARIVADPAFNIFYNAPVLVVICATLPDPMVRHDCALAAATLMLAAHDKGLGSCWIGFSESWLALDATRRALGIPDGVVPVAPLILGYPATIPAPPPRKKPEIRWVGSDD
jgi:nitroreductase